MPTIIIPEKPFFAQTITEAKAICSPLFNSSMVKNFSYMRINRQKQINVLLTMDPLYLIELNKNGYTKCIEHPHFNTNDNVISSYHFVDANEPEAAELVKKWFNVCNPFLIVDSHKDYMEVVVFATDHADSKNYEYYFNNLDMLKKFKAYFLVQANKLLKEGEGKQLQILTPPKRNNISKEGIPCYPKRIISEDVEFKNNFVCKRYPLVINGKEYYLTARELKCLSLLAHGKQMKQVASIMQISPRTVETFYNNIKSRLGIFSREQMIDLYFRYNLGEMT
jgi:DNA-binding CsgD family transcriptional regulator